MSQNGLGMILAIEEVPSDLIKLKGTRIEPQEAALPTQEESAPKKRGKYGWAMKPRTPLGKNYKLGWLIRA